ncbi:MAG TPA: hypothetical protein VL494_21875 [Steroidobacteraceae bacterium]|jgi:hypothetical protein|nr:hypothetical protein [Steroidobacteraceae bacterium]
MSACEQWVIELPDELVSEAARLRASGALGKPGPLSRLFEFLLGRSGGSTPKEIEIAVAVFNKKSDFDIGQDALVRVYVHKLRKRLEEYYLRNPGARRMVIPKGEYRLVVEAVPGAVVEVVQERVGLKPDLQPDNKRQSHAAVILAFVLGVVLAVGAALVVNMQRAKPQAASASPIWSSLLADDLPVTIVVGDYYLLGEVDQSGDVKRLVREFNINSEAEFIDYLELHPSSAQQYRNLRLTYLPTGTAVALADVSALLAGRKQVRIKLMSELDGETLRTSHVVYIGYLSGLGMLGDFVFGASRLRLQGTYDQLVDSTTERSYTARMPQTPERSFVDYGYFATMQGPAGNRIIVVAGTRDNGVMQSAAAATDPKSLAAWVAESGHSQGFESLTEVQGVDRTNLSTNRIFVAPLD